MNDSTRSDNVLDVFAKQFSRISFARGDYIIREGDHTDTMYVVAAGRVKVFVSDPDGKELWLAEYAKGDFIGELALDGAPRSASASALEDGTQCIVITRKTMLDFITLNPEFALEVIMVLISRTRKATTVAKSVALDAAEIRIIEYLNEYSITIGVERVLRPKPNFQAIGDKLGCSRDMVSKVVKKLKQKGNIAEDEHGFILNGMD